MRPYSFVVRHSYAVLALGLFLVTAQAAPGQDAPRTAPITFQPRTYTMVSVPVDLVNPDFGAVLEDDYGAYSINVWRLFRYNPITDDYDEYPNTGDADFSRGTAVWLINQNGQSFDVEEAPTNLEDGVPITVFPGWNQVGTPFPFTIDCRRLLDNLPPEAGIDEVEGPVYYDGVEFRYDRTECRPWEGYFFYVRADGPRALVIPPLRPGDGQPVAKAASPIQIDPASEYVLQLSATMARTGLRDTQNYVGLLHDAREGSDERDFMEAPPIGDHVRLSIVEAAHRFAGNFKPLDGHGYRWDIEVQATRTDQPIAVALQERGQLPEGFQRYLLDVDHRTAVALDDDAFRVQLAGADQVRRFTLILGTQAYAEAHSTGISLVPAAYALLPNYPNPFNPETLIRYQIGQRGPVQIDIYNVLGQRVRRLVDATQAAGSHAVRWDGLDEAGQPVASGTYLYRLQAGSFADTRTMILMR